MKSKLNQKIEKAMKDVIEVKIEAKLVKERAREFGLL